MIANGDSTSPVWVTEWGWPSPPLSEVAQSTYVAQSLRLLDRVYTYVTVATYFTEFDQPGFTHGLFHSDWRPKPAAAAFRAFTDGRR